MITFVNGPYNARQIEDSGAVLFRLAIYDGGEQVGATTGEAIYEPNAERTHAFWSHNNWLGKIDERFSA